MSIWEIILIGAGLSMDAAAVSVSNTLCLKKITLKHILMMCLSFGLFQCLMPIIGYFGASLFQDYIKMYDHWIALVLLLFIGGKMVIETFRHKDEDDTCETGFRLTLKLIAVQAVATSIDALAIGISFSALNVNIFIAVSIIAAITFACSMIAVAHYICDLSGSYTDCS